MASHQHASISTRCTTPPTPSSRFHTCSTMHHNTSAEDNEQTDTFIRLQNARLKGFTTLALIENDLISERRLRVSGLTNPIHLLLARDRWEVHTPVSNSLFRCLCSIGFAWAGAEWRRNDGNLRELSLIGKDRGC
ncbi:hypothetical protein ONS95_015070 [Cadophora gregata]|uniref:uncharacterized protein n=1 Tax=Cadophora gregata TaxID=51156 RepID=UPI0026DA92BE|nr:uncharacterized protein ONS95_015070 [Cadophora gregata]KAK0113663.1 hypothetical protein ONS96_014980 [Cadophora gregata f. sp. sojae]KAK0114419.1 hypothetical protein ONS95_015070 [Cadophora gregata]